MTSRPIQRDFGGFDSKFTGVALRMWPKSWELFGRLHGPDSTPQKVLRIGNDALAGSIDEAFETFSTGTVLLHELRHFHDFLLSPFGNTIFRLRLKAAVNGMTVVGELKRLKACLPVPFGRWRRMAPAEQAELLSLWRTMTGTHWDAPPALLSHDAQLALEQAVQAYASIGNLIAAPPNKTSVAYSPAHIFEGSAIIVQSNNVYNFFGAAHSELFLNYMLNKPEAQAYTFPLRAMYLMAEEQDRAIDAALLSAALTWSILGDFAAEGWDASPTSRFARLVDLFRREGLPDSDVPAAELLAGWSARLNTLPVETALNNSTVANHKMQDQLDALGLAQNEEFAELMSVSRSFVQAQEAMATSFKREPERYIRPHLYAESVDTWVAAPMRLEFPHLPLVGRPEDLEPELGVRVAQRMADGKLAVRSALLLKQTSGRTLFDTEAAADLTDQLNLVDFFLAEFRRDEPDFDVTRQVLADEGMTTFEIL